MNKKESLCVSLVESYGKLIFGTKDKTLVELDVAEILDSIGIQHNYNKAPFMNEDENKEFEPNGKIKNILFFYYINHLIIIIFLFLFLFLSFLENVIKVDNFKIMDSLIKKNYD